MQRPSPLSGLWLPLLAYLSCFLFLAALAQRLPLSERFFPQFWTAWFGAVIGIWLVFLFSRDADEPQRLRWRIFGGIGVDIVCNRVAAMVPPGQEGVLQWLFLALGNLGMMAVAIAAGILVARGLQKPNYLIMAAIVGAVTDIFSVYSGPSKFTMNSSVFPYVSYQWGVVGQGGTIPIIGAGDFIFLALYFAGTRRFHLSETKTFVAMCAAFGVGFLSILVIPQGVPALPFMAMMLLLVHGRALNAQMRALKAEEAT
jgi:hypothetical protein